MHARRYLFKALESDEPHMGPALHLIARLYAVEERAKALSLSAEQRLALRQRVSARLIGKLHQYLLELQPQVLPKSPSGAAVRYALNQWEALTRFLEDGDLEIDNGATERANRDIALGRGYVQQRIMYSRLQRESGADHFSLRNDGADPQSRLALENSRLHIITASGGNGERCRWADSVSV
jgi:Transposase IS66 family